MKCMRFQVNLIKRKVPWYFSLFWFGSKKIENKADNKEKKGSESLVNSNITSEKNKFILFSTCVVEIKISYGAINQIGFD